MSELTRPVLRYHGGKWLLADWIISFFPKHAIYAEPFGGAASVLLQKPRSASEIYNDLNTEVVNLFRVLRDPVGAHHLMQQLKLTPYARDEFEAAYEDAVSPIEKARRLIVRSFMAYGSTGCNPEYCTGFRSFGTVHRVVPAREWVNYPDSLAAVVNRLRGVVIENRPALEIIRSNDTEETLFYLDPPYVFDTRRADKAGKMYAHEMTDSQHMELLEAIQLIKGYVVLSGYAHPLYDHVLKGWTRIDRETYADGANKRTESLWLNPACAAAQAQQQLFTEVA